MWKNHWIAIRANERPKIKDGNPNRKKNGFFQWKGFSQFSTWNRFIFPSFEFGFFLEWIIEKWCKELKKNENEAYTNNNNGIICSLKKTWKQKWMRKKQWNFHKDENKRQNKVRKTHRDICLCAQKTQGKTRDCECCQWFICKRIVSKIKSKLQNKPIVFCAEKKTRRRRQQHTDYFFRFEIPGLPINCHCEFVTCFYFSLGDRTRKSREEKRRQKNSQISCNKSWF